MTKINELLTGMWYWLLDLREEHGQDLIEYALIAALVSVGIVVAVALSPLQNGFTTWAGDVVTCITGDAAACDALF